MVLVKILGLLDFFVGMNLILLKWQLFPYFALIMGLIVLFKALIFIGSDPVVSAIDITCLFFFFLALAGAYFYFTWLFSLWFFQKSFFSLVA